MDNEINKNGLIDPESLEILEVATKLAQVASAFQKRFIEDQKDSCLLIMPTAQASVLMSHLDDATHRAVALLARIMKERAVANNVPMVEHPLTRFTYN